MIKIEDYMIKDLKLGGNELLIYAALISHMENGYCNTTQPQLAEEVGLSINTIARSIAKLKSKKIIDVKEYRDGFQKRNCITVKDDIANMNNCEELKHILIMWNQCIHVEVLLTADIYRAWTVCVDKIGPDYFVKLEKAIDRYAKILNNVRYYKSYVCPFKKFLEYKFADYLDNGIEWTEYCRFIDKLDRTSFNEMDKRSYEEEYGIIGLDAFNPEDI